MSVVACESDSKAGVCVQSGESHCPVGGGANFGRFEGVHVKLLLLRSCHGSSPND